MPPIHTAQRNALLLRWWASCSDGFKVATRALYGQAYGIPLCKLCDIDTFARDDDVLIWLAANYPHTIEAFQEDQR